ncbi:hypothetical protein [Gracilibacillus lacisalsi]|uniref:hypothetical protein n=1 Tax=Gracilibacillus lacisalsi TaxID=393087 RepID=UPI000375F905|nr:hypothetical protein [Gracilibacillus lacisalsi]
MSIRSVQTEYCDVHNKFDIEWVDEETLLIINESPEYPSSDKSMELNVETEIFHDIGLACQSWLMKSGYETCYEE